MLSNEELPDGKWAISTHSDKVCTEFAKLGYDPESMENNEGITLWRFVLPNKDVVKQTPELTKALLEASIDLSLIVKRFEPSMFVVGDGTSHFGSLDPSLSEVGIVFAKEQSAIPNGQVTGEDKGPPVITQLTTWTQIRDVLKVAQSKDVKFVLRFLNSGKVEKHNLPIVLWTAETMCKQDGTKAP